MLAHGLYAEHLIALLTGIIGFFVGFAAIYMAGSGKRYWELVTGLTSAAR